MTILILEKVIMPLLVVAITGLLGWIVRLLKKADRDRRANADASRALLYDKLKYLCELHIMQGYIDLDDRKNLDTLYSAYHNLNGNGFIKGIYNIAMKLPIERKDSHA